MTKRRQRAGLPQSGGLSLNVLTEAELNEIHQATMEVMGETGLSIANPKAQEVYARGGARVDVEKNRVYFPARLVEESMRLAPRSFVVHGRRPEDDVLLGNNRVTYMSFGEGVEIVDLHSGRIRPTTIEDLVNLTRVIDYIDVLDLTCTVVNGIDLPQELNGLYNSLAVLLNSTKPFDSGFNNVKEAEYLYRMAEALVGPENMASRPPFFSGGCPISPLKIPEDLADVIMFSAEKKMPQSVLSMAMSGGSSPVHLAGTLVVHNAEVLAGLTLAQLINPGNPVFFSSSTTAMNLKTATATVGSPELALFSAGVAALANYYKVPCLVAGT